MVTYYTVELQFLPSNFAQKLTCVVYYMSALCVHEI